MINKILSALRYILGLEKLNSAAEQVSDMQQKLFDLQPKLKQLSDETEQIMVTIERDTAQAEKKKEVSSHFRITS